MSNQRTRQMGTLWAGVGLGVVGGYLLTQQLWVLWRLMTQDVGRSLRLHQNKAPKGRSFSEVTETEAYTRRHTIQADYLVAAKSRHNVMMEHNWYQTAETVHEWLVKQGIDKARHGTM